MKKNNKKTWFFKKKDFNLDLEKLLLKIIIMKETKPNAVKLKSETVEKIKNINLETGWVVLSTYDDKINHLIWLYEKYIKELEEIKNK